MNILHRISRKLRKTTTQLQYKLAANYNLNGYRRVYHIHIRKTGGTSLNHMFLDLAKKTVHHSDVYKELVKAEDHRVILNGNIYVGWNTNLINQGDYFYAFSHSPLHELNLPANTFTVTVLRDPIKRVLSHYKMLVEYKDNNIDHPAMQTEGVLLGNSFDDFLDRIPKEGLLRQVYMFSPSFNVEEAFHEIKNCSHFMFTEDFDSGISSLNSKLAIHLKPIHLRQTKSTLSISDGQIFRLKKMLSKEYELITRLRESLG